MVVRNGPIKQLRGLGKTPTGKMKRRTRWESRVEKMTTDRNQGPFIGTDTWEDLKHLRRYLDILKREGRKPRIVGITRHTESAITKDTSPELLKEFW